MAKFQIQGLSEYAAKLSHFNKNYKEDLKVAVYMGADVVANEVKSTLKSLPIEEGKNGLPPYAAAGEKLTGVSRIQKADLIDGMGLAPMKEENGYINTKLGWAGYGRIKTKKYPKGVPNQMLMRSIESGTSFRQKNPVIRKAINKVKKQAVDVMSDSIDKSIRKEFE